MIGRINKVLAKVISTEEYRTLSMEWVKESRKPDVRQSFEKRVLSEARNYAP